MCCSRGDVIIPVCFMLFIVFTLIPLYPVFLSYSNGKSQQADACPCLCVSSFPGSALESALSEISARFLRAAVGRERFSQSGASMGILS